METLFLADSMLGRLAKWLRVLGYDTCYEKGMHSHPGTWNVKGRTLLTRDGRLERIRTDVVRIRSNRIFDQLAELRQGGWIAIRADRLFSRCICCNTPLQKTDPLTIRDHIPEYVFYRNREKVRTCPSCGKFFWPGTHRRNMLRQLAAWGLLEIPPAEP